MTDSIKDNVQHVNTVVKNELEVPSVKGSMSLARNRSIFWMLQALNLGLQFFITAVCLWLNSSWFLPKHCGCRNQAMENACHPTLAFELWIPATLKFTEDFIARQLSFKDKPSQRYGNLPDFNCIIDLWKISTFHTDIRKWLRASPEHLSLQALVHFGSVTSRVIPEPGFRQFLLYFFILFKNSFIYVKDLL